MEQATDAIFVHDLEGRFVDVNQQACESLGYIREELLEMYVPEVEADYDSESVAKLWGEISRGSSRTVDGSHRRKDGTTFLVEVRLGLFESEGESLLVASARDITERKRNEEELVRLASFPRLNPNPVVEMTVSGKVTYLNPAAEAWFPDLVDRKHHSLLADFAPVAAEIEHSKGRPLNREIQVGDKSYLQTFSRLPESGRLRT